MLGRRAVLGLSLGTSTAAAIGVVRACSRPGWDAFARTRLDLATGNRGGVFDRYGAALAGALGDRLDGVTARTVSTDASVENAVLVASGRADLGFSLADTAADALRGSGGFGAPRRLTALARTYDSFVQLVVRAGSGITDVRDLRGTAVGLGAPGSGTRVIARRVLHAAGLRVHDVRVASEPLEQSAAALAAGRLDAFFFVSGVPNTALSDLSRALDIRLVDLDRWLPALVATYGLEYGPGPVPASTYDLATAAQTVSVKNYVLADPRMSEDLAYAVTRVMFEAQDEIDRRAPGVRQPSLGAAIFTSPVPLHPGAVRYYRQTQP